MDCASQVSRESALSLPSIWRLTLPFPWDCGQSPQRFQMAWPLPVIVRSFDPELAEGFRSPGTASAEGPKGGRWPARACDLLEAAQLGERRPGS